MSPTLIAVKFATDRSGCLAVTRAVINNALNAFKEELLIQSSPAQRDTELVLAIGLKFEWVPQTLAL